MECAGNPDRPHVVRHAKGKRPQFYEADGLDHAMSMIMTLANELCVLRDRLDAHERVAAARGIDLAKEIDGLILDELALQQREAWRQAFLERLFYLARKDAAEAAGAETSEQYEKTISEIAED